MVFNNKNVGYWAIAQKEMREKFILKGKGKLKPRPE